MANPSTVSRRPTRAPAPAATKLRPWGKVEIFEDVEQGSEEWFQLRLGIPTASVFSMVMRTSDAKTRTDLMYRLAGEVLTGRPAEGKIITAAMERGKEMEPEAREQYEQRHFGEVRSVGFIRRKIPSGRYVGASPDALIGDKKALEIKTMAPHLMIERLVNGAGLPPEHRPQVHGTMMVGDLEEVDLILFYRGMPITPKFTVRRDDTYIREIQNSVEIFDFELHKLVEKIRRMG